MPFTSKKASGKAAPGHVRTSVSESLATIRIRPMQVTDLPMVHALEEISQPTPWPTWFFRRQLRNDRSCRVLELDGEIVGFGIVSFVGGWAHIMNMCVAPAYRRHGLGRHMMLHLLVLAKRRRCREAWLEVRSTNRPAISLYRELGFRVVHVRKGYYRTRHGRRNALVMVRPVRASAGTEPTGKP